MEPKHEMKNLNNNLGELEKILLNPADDLSNLTAQQQYQIIVDKVSDQHPEPIIPLPSEKDSLLARLEESKETGEPLIIKFGIDPTGKDIHIGHAVSLLMLRRFQKMGHKIQLVIGSFTAKIGDSSGSSSERKVLTDQQIEENLKTYISQASKVIDLEKEGSVTHHYNAEWHNKMKITDWIEIGHSIGAYSLVERNDFQKRKKKGGFVSMSEALYPLFMAWDSVVLQPDIELGGVDQYLNLLFCRQLMTYAQKSPKWSSIAHKKAETFVIINLLPGTTGQRDDENRLIKMSKSLGNFIPMAGDPADMFGKTMSIPDEVMWVWFRELTEITGEQLKWLKAEVEKGNIHPADAKRVLARTVVGAFNNYDKEIIKAAENDFNSRTGKSKNQIPEDAPRFKTPANIKDALSIAFSDRTKSELRRLVDQKGIRVLTKDGKETILTNEMFATGKFEGEEVFVRVGRQIVSLQIKA